MKVKFKRLTDTAKLPNYANPGDAGMDVYADEDVVIKPHETVFISTGLAAAVPEGYAALAWDKSGVARKKGLKVMGGVLDAPYRGEWLIGLFNTGIVDQSFCKGEKITQVLIQKVERAEIEEVTELDETERGTGGFGSTDDPIGR